MTMVELTERERQVAYLVGQGFSDARIAKGLGLSVRTVGAHVSHVMIKFQIPRNERFNRRVLLALIVRGNVVVGRGYLEGETDSTD